MHEYIELVVVCLVIFLQHDSLTTQFAVAEIIIPLYYISPKEMFHIFVTRPLNNYLR